MDGASLGSRAGSKYLSATLGNLGKPVSLQSKKSENAEDFG